MTSKYTSRYANMASIATTPLLSIDRVVAAIHADKPQSCSGLLSMDRAETRASVEF
jgi:hypothetical protein